MKIDTPYIIVDEPQKPTKTGLFSRIKFEIEYRAYLRTRAGEAQNWKCCYCGVECITEKNSKRSATLEHITPRSHGGEDTYENAAMACAGCNNSRGSMCYEEFMEKMKRGDITFGMTKRQKDEVWCQKVKERRGKKFIKKAERLAENDWVAPSGRPITFQEWFGTLREMDQASHDHLQATYG